MLGNWSQGGPPGPPQNYNNNYNASPPKAPNGRPPICFTCGQEGHYVKDCQNQNQNGQVAMAASQASQAPQAANVDVYSAIHQTKQWANVQNGQMGSKYAPHPGFESASVSQFTGPGQYPQINGPPVHASYAASNPPYQQYPTTHPQQQNHQQQGHSHQAYSNYNQNKQYKQPVANGPQSYQAPFNQYPQSNSPQLYGLPTHPMNGQHYPFPSTPTTPFQPQENDYSQDYNNQGPSATYQDQGPSNQGQWNGSPPAATPFNAPQPQQEQPNSGINRDFRRSQSQQSQQSQQGESQLGSQQPSFQSPELNKRGLYIPRSKNTPHTAPHKLSSQPAEASRASSEDSTPYGSPTANNNISEWDGHPAALEEGSDRTDEEKQFNWDYKSIFKPAGEKHETVALAQPLANRFDMTPVPLIDKKSTITISRYARRENLKEYMRSVRKTPQWPYLQEDPTFQESQTGEDSISFEDLDAYMKLRHGNAYTPVAARKASAVISRTGKRKASTSEQDDVDEQLQNEFSTLQNKRQKVDDQSQPSNHADGLPRFSDNDAGNKSPTLAEASDDIWAPQAGESADPTEALLASLGVSGAPKPVEPGPPVMIPIEEFQQPIYSPQQPPYDPQQASYNTQQAPYSQQPQFNVHQPPYNAQQPSYIQQLPFNAQQLTYTQQPPFNPQQPPYNQQYHFNAQQPYYSQQPPFNPPQASFHTQQPFYNAQQPYNPQQHAFHPSMANQPFRQDPSYANARPPFSAPQMLNQHIPPPPPPPPMEEEPLFDPWPEHNVTTTPPPPDHTDNDKENGDKENLKKGDEGYVSPESPLSPTSLEILGKINKIPVKPRKIVRVISGKKGKESQRPSEDGAPKLKRAAPVVDAAYSRRW
ncbi:hypothetical protein SBOR_4217 [Sclerotinia borealis F-4128]|uniref:CCHC-type domain-containing protein n=1 Tax=Sclerotinia borealis (strain F-4128) TaxID=1432307 RepID=W9CHP3_SCLBF|nr:hypothetical protein SBOR_4217 [Sclerotinia borealis F-4128]